MPKSIQQPVVVIPNLNGADALRGCIDSLLAQTLQPYIIVVDNGSTDDSVALLNKYYPDIELIKHAKNLGYAGGVNPGFRRAIELGASYTAPFNNDAVADKLWLETLVQFLDAHPEVGAACCKVLSSDGSHLDSTGDYYTNWGLPYPRGRGETDVTKYDSLTEIFAASGAASLYRVAALRQVGLMDEDFFAYYEDVDLSFRLQLAGWRVAFVPNAQVYHATGSTSGGMKGFTTYQTIKNYPWLVIKDVPQGLLHRVWPRLLLAQFFFFGRAIIRGHLWYALKGFVICVTKIPKMLRKRRHIQRSKKVSKEYIWQLMVHDLPPNAHNLRRLRKAWWKVKGKQA